MAALALLVLASPALPASLAVTSPYVRPPTRATLSLPRDDDADGQTPQQVRLPSSVSLCSQTDVLRRFQWPCGGLFAFRRASGNLTTRF